MARLRFRRLFLPPPRVLRLTAYLTCVFLVCAALAANSLYAAGKEAGQALGHQLLGLSEYTRGAETVLVNGARFHHSATSTADSLKTVLDRLEAHCRATPGSVASALAALSAERPGMLEQSKMPEMFRNGLIRDESDTRGMVVCFVGERRLGLRDLPGLLKDFQRTSDLSTFGFLRYAFAERRPDGRTRVVALWTDDSIKLSEMFPATGDAAGPDSQLLPRPPQSRRVLAAAAEGMPFAVRSYETPLRLASLRASYERWMSERDFRQVRADVEHGAFAYQRADGLQVFLLFAEQKEKTFVTITEAGRTPAGQIVTVESRLE